MQLKHFESKFGTQIISNIEDIERIRSIWEELQQSNALISPNADIDHYITVLKNMPEAVKPYILAIYDAGKPVSMIIGRIDIRKFEFKIGYRTFYRQTVKCLDIVYGGLFINNSITLLEYVVHEILSVLKTQNLDLIAVHFIPVDTELYHLLTTIPKSIYRENQPITRTHWTMDLPESIEIFFKSRSKKHRSNLRTYGNRLKKDHSNNVTVKCFTSLNDINLLLRDAEEVAKKTYQRGMNEGFHNNELTRARMSLAAEKGWLQSYILYVNNKPCAFQMGFCYGGTYFVAGKGYDPAFKKYRIGTYLFLQILEKLCDDEKMNKWDFGIGDADYKELYGNNSWSEALVFIFSPTWRGLKLSLMWKVTKLLSGLVENISNRINLANTIKRKWRTLLTPHSDATDLLDE